jgi:Gas vesicle synthesis protein GvpL/GvpF
VIEVYAVTDRPEAPLPPLGRLERVTEHGLAGIYTTGSAAPDTSAEALWRHEQVVEALMDDRAALPMRYGTVLADEGQLRRALVDRRGEFSRLLDAVRGHIELAVRVLLPPDEDRDARARSGREYMGGLLRRRSAAAGTLALLGPLEGIADAMKVREGSAADHHARYSFLVDRDRLDEFQAELQELGARHRGLQLTCTGPWPPYSFVAGGAS